MFIQQLKFPIWTFTGIVKILTEHGLINADYNERGKDTMMKNNLLCHARYIVCLVCAVLLLASCNGTPPKTDPPLYAELCKVSFDMGMEEVYALVGSPVQTETLEHGSVCHTYESRDDGSICVTWQKLGGRFIMESIEYEERVTADPPLYAALCEVSTDMGMEEVHALLGPPQKKKISRRGSIYHTYVSRDGGSICVGWEQENAELCRIEYSGRDTATLPSYEVLCQVKPGMTQEEIYALLGSPKFKGYTDMIDFNHIESSWAPFETRYRHTYEAEDGSTIDVFFEERDADGQPKLPLPIEDPDHASLFAIQVMASKEIKPSYEAVCSLSVGMTEAEVYQALGAPVTASLMRTRNDPQPGSYSEERRLHYFYDCTDAEAGRSFLAAVIFDVDPDEAGKWGILKVLDYDRGLVISPAPQP